MRRGTGDFFEEVDAVDYVDADHEVAGFGKMAKQLLFEVVVVDDK